MKAKGTRTYWFPNDIILHHTSARPTSKFCADFTNIFSEHHASKRTTRFPTIANLTSKLLCTFAFLPVDFVRLYSRFELTSSI
jgi:hypothetical protein